MAIVRVPVRLEFPQDGGPGFNIWHVSTQPGGQPGDLGEALDALEAFYNRVKSFMPGPGKIVLGEGMIIDPGGSPTYADDDSRTITLPLGTDPQPSLLAIVCGWRTASATRSGRGRTFVGPWGTNALENDGTPNQAVLTALREAATILLDDSQSANGWAIGVLSTKQGTFREATGVTVRDRFAVLRSRRP